MPASERRGRIFDIQRFSVHDGAGIRTCVFFKGCPLCCSWCQNPEGVHREREVIWIERSCIRCGTCTGLARAGGLAWNADEHLVVRGDAPEDWDRLMEACPSGALRFSGTDYTVQEVMDIVRRDAPFYRHGGGGITLTGGDPVLQAEFAGALLRQCRSENIHTAMETEAALPWEKMDPLLADLDEIYVDLKLVDPEDARRHTGQDSTVVLSNLTKLLTGSHASKVTVRTPLIPGITATEKNLMEAASFLAALNPDATWELLNYNPLAPAKYPMLGRRYALAEDLPAFTAHEMETFSKLAARGGMRRVIWEHGESA